MKWIKNLYERKPSLFILGRQLSTREKLLCTLFLGLLLELIAYRLIYQPMNAEIFDLSNRGEIAETKNQKKYVGMLNFSQEQMPELLKYAPVLNSNFQISYEGEQKILNLDFDVAAAHLENLDDLTKWFGYSRYDLHRLENGNFQVLMQVEKPVEDVYYDDIRVSYLQKDEKLPEKIPPIVREPAGPSYSPAPVLPPKKREIKLSEPNSLSKEIKKQDQSNSAKTSEIKTQEADKETGNLNSIPSPEEKNEEMEKKKKDTKPLDLSQIYTTGYHSSHQWKDNTKALYIYYKSNGEDELKIIFPKEIMKGDFEFFIPQNILGEFVLLRADGSEVSYAEPIYGGKWNNIFIHETIPVTAVIYRSPEGLEEENVISMRSFTYEK